MKKVNETLVEQMGYSPREIARRLHLINFTDAEVRLLMKAGEEIELGLDAVIDAFYVIQLKIPEVRDLIGDADTLSRLHDKMVDYARSLFSGQYDMEYVNARLRIGRVHKQLGVTPELYMKGLSGLQSLLDQEVERIFFVEQVQDIKKALHKVLLFDAELIFDSYIETYFNQVDQATREVQKYAGQVGIKVEHLFSRLHDKLQRDTLTGLHNRSSLNEFLKHECRMAERHKLPFVLVYLDLNRFKPVNDEHGHHAGDKVLRDVSEAMLAVTRAVDICVRYGGDEFCLLLPRTTLDQAKTPLDRLVAKFDALCEYPVTFSMGVIQVGPEVVPQPEAQLRVADKLMYAAKKHAHKDGKHHRRSEILTEALITHFDESE